MANIKLSALPLLAENPADTDRFLLTDDDTPDLSKAIEFSQLKTSILGDLSEVSSISTIRDGLNQFGSAGGSNLLNATRVWYQPTTQSVGEYRFLIDLENSANSILQYDNIVGAPAVVTKLGQLTNDSDASYISFDVDAQEGTNRLKVIYRLGTDDAASATPPSLPANRTINTDDIQEATAATNQWYTDGKVRGFLDDNFQSYFEAASGSFDGGTSADSLESTTGTFTLLGDSSSTLVSISDYSLFKNYSTGQTLRVYGANIAGTTDLALSSVEGFSVSTSITGFGSDGGNVEFSYQVCLFDFNTGQISGPSGEGSITQEIIQLNTSQYPDVTDPKDLFNTDNFIKLDFNGLTGTDYGVLVYRRVGGSGSYKLAAVLGPKDLSANSYIDYYTFDYTSWSGKDANDNTYLAENTVHFPVTLPSGPRKGWQDVTISTITDNETSFDLTFTPALNLNAPAPQSLATLCHNDTATLQSAINTSSGLGRKSLRLNAKQYIAERITLPNNFGLDGSPYVTKIRKLPWSGYSTTPNGNLISKADAIGAKTITLSGIDVDGNVTNQYLFNDNNATTDLSKARNYLINLGSTPSNIIFDRVRMISTAGGGIYMTGVEKFNMSSSEINNSGVTDRHLYNPIIADSSENVILSGNLIQNFTDYIDLSLTDTSVVSNNIIKNTGSGLFIYGARFLISSPNVLIGPANEFLPSPDILNSEYDSVNIDLTGAYLANSTFYSDIITYSENGDSFDLTVTAGDPAQIVYDTSTLQKLPDGSEGIYDSGVSDVTLLDVVNTENVIRANGNFQFSIAKEDVISLKQEARIKEFTSLTYNGTTGALTTTGDFGQEINVGEVLTISGTTDSGLNGTDFIVTNVNTSFYTIDATSNNDIQLGGANSNRLITTAGTDLTPISSGDTIVISGTGTISDGTYTVNDIVNESTEIEIDGVFPQTGTGFGGVITQSVAITSLNVTADPVASNFTALAGKLIYNKEGSRSYTKLKELNSNHIGWIWSASQQTDVTAAFVNTISDTSTISNDLKIYSDAGSTQINGWKKQSAGSLNAIFSFTPNESFGVKYLNPDPAQPSEVIGNEVKIKTLTGFNSGGVLTGTVVSATSELIEILFLNAITGSNNQTLAPGTPTGGESITLAPLTESRLVIVDKFVLAQGRIL